MSLHLENLVPDFTANTTIGELNLYNYLGNSWGILFSHPADFTPVCTTELGRTAQLAGEFERRNVKVLALSVDSLAHHHDWLIDIEETQQTNVHFPIIADEDRSIACLYGMIHPNASATFTVRSLFIIGPDKRLKLSLTYPASVGRNFNEVLRVVDSLQLTSQHSVATPADWQPGQDVVVLPSVTTAEAELKFPGMVTEVKPYLRFVPQPG